MKNSLSGLPGEAFTKVSVDDPSALKGLPRGVRDGVLSRIQRAQRESELSQNSHVREYFQRHRFQESQVDVIDGSTGWYSRFAHEFFFQSLPSSCIGSLIEFGCGQATVVSQLKARCIQFENYTGYDLYISDAQKRKFSGDPNVRLVENDISQFESTVGVLVDPAILLAVNTICYISQLKDSSLSKIHKKNISDLVLVEPFPSIFWEKRFGGVEVHFRKPSVLKAFLRKSGYAPSATAKLYLFRIGMMHFWPIAYAIHFKRAKWNEPPRVD